MAWMTRPRLTFLSLFHHQGSGQSTGLAWRLFTACEAEWRLYLGDQLPGKGHDIRDLSAAGLRPVPKFDLETKPSAIPHGSETILVAEDEAGVRELACQFLRVKATRCWKPKMVVKLWKSPPSILGRYICS